MFGFFIKKNFFDGWENIINILIPNLMTMLVMVLAAVGFYFGFSYNPISLMLMYIMIIFAVAFIVVFVSAFCENAAQIASNETAHVSDYFKMIPRAFKENFVFGLLTGMLFVSAVIGVPMYIVGLGSFFGVMLGMILLMFVIVMVLAFQWFLPLKALLKFDSKKAAKKCFVILFDNFGFSVGMLLYSIVLLAFSVFMVFFLPGFNGILLGYVNALRLRLYKYDWLDQHPELKKPGVRKNIPWDALCKEDSDYVGKKSIKSLFMPWKGDHED